VVGSADQVMVIDPWEVGFEDICKLLIPMATGRSAARRLILQSIFSVVKKVAEIRAKAFRR